VGIRRAHQRKSQRPRDGQPSTRDSGVAAAPPHHALTQVIPTHHTLLAARSLGLGGPRSKRRSLQRRGYQLNAWAQENDHGGESTPQLPPCRPDSGPDPPSPENGPQALLHLGHTGTGISQGQGRLQVTHNLGHGVLGGEVASCPLALRFRLTEGGHTFAMRAYSAPILPVGGIGAQTSRSAISQ
jgi:hypothetical protein